MFCQLAVLRHCLAPSLRRQLNELPESLDETYGRVLKEIESTNQGRHARRLLQCLAVAMRPLRVEELAEVLAFDLDTAEGEVPIFHPEWRWEDQEHAVLSACSSLITIVNGDDSRVIQFSHFSVKEYLISDRLATASGDISHYHIVPERAHLILARACLGGLLTSHNRLHEECDESNDEGNGKNSDEGSIIRLLEYAAEHWVSHAQVGNVSSRLKDTIEALFDLNEPYFLAWIRKYNISPYASWHPMSDPKPLHYASLCGFHDLVRRLIVKHPEQVNHHISYFSPLVAALSKNHIRVAKLLLDHGAHAHARVDSPLLQAIEFPDHVRVNAMQCLLEHGTRRAHVNAGDAHLRTPLHLAAEVGCPEVTRILLEHGADVGLRDNDGRVPLHLVSGWWRVKDENKRLILTRLLLEHSADVNAQDMRGATPLHLASYHRRPTIARLLLNRGANINAENAQGRNPMHELALGPPPTSPDDFAVIRGLEHALDLQTILSVAQLFLEHGVDVNALDRGHLTPLHLASSYGMFEIAQLLLDLGAKADAENDRGQTPLHLVLSESECFHPNSNVARLFLELGVDVNARDKNQATPLHFVSSLGHFETALALLDHGAYIDAQNVDGETPLHRVSQLSEFNKYDLHPLAQLLLERGADVNARDKDQATPLHFASFYGHFKVVLALLDHGADVNAQNADGETPLHRVSPGLLYPGAGYAPLVQLLLEHGADVNSRNKNLETPLHIASSLSKLGVARMLLDHGANIHAENVHGQTPLHIVSQHDISTDESDLVELLLSQGADVNARDKNQATALLLACIHLKLKIAEGLLKNGADIQAVNIHGQNALHLVSQIDFYNVLGPDHGELAMLSLKRGVDVNGRDKDERTPLHLASRKGDEVITKVLLNHRAQVNAKDTRGQTSLHHVILGYQHYLTDSREVPWERDRRYRLRSANRLAQQLLERGADVNAQNKDLETSLHLASRFRLHETARILLKHGADVNVKNSEGKSPLQLAPGRKGKAMRRLLSEYSAK